jgi:hypothetical protein
VVCEVDTGGELEAIGVTIGTKKWHRLFGKCDHQANYLLCDKCYHRHFAVPIGSGKFHCVDETGECEIVHEISTNDLALYALKKQSFLNDLQRCAFELEPEKIEEIVPTFAGKLGHFWVNLEFISFTLPMAQLSDGRYSKAWMPFGGPGKSRILSFCY